MGLVISARQNENHEFEGENSSIQGRNCGSVVLNLEE